MFDEVTNRRSFGRAHIALLSAVIAGHGVTAAYIVGRYSLRLQLLPRPSQRTLSCVYTQPQPHTTPPPAPAKRLQLIDNKLEKRSDAVFRPKVQRQRAGRGYAGAQVAIANESTTIGPRTTDEHPSSPGAITGSVVGNLGAFSAMPPLPKVKKPTPPKPYLNQNSFSIHYSDEARKKNIRGMIHARLLIDRHGKVVDVRIVRGLGYGLDREAQRVARTLRYHPGTNSEGRPRRAWVERWFLVGPR